MRRAEGEHEIIFLDMITETVTNTNLTLQQAGGNSFPYGKTTKQNHYHNYRL